MDDRRSLSRDDEVPIETAATKPDAVPPKIVDYYKWAFEQAALIRAGRFEQVDILNVAEEIEDVGKSDFRALESNLEIVLLHILKWEHQPARRSRSWSDSIFEHRSRILKLMRVSPSMKTRRDEAVGESYGFARRAASRQTKLILSRFPEACPYSWSDIMDKPYELDDERG